MPKRIALLSLLILAMFLTACGGDDEDAKKPDPTATLTPTLEPTATSTPTPEPTESPAPTPTEDTTPSITSTPMNTADLPAIELLSGYPETCVITEGYSELVGYAAAFYETTTENPVNVRLLDAEDNELIEARQQGENKDGEEGWGWYPDIYEVPEDSELTVELTVYLSEDEDAPATSLTTLTYNCTTGETISTSFTRNP